MSRRPLDFQSYFSSLVSLCSAFLHRPPIPLYSSSSSLRERQSTVEFTRPSPISHLSLKATPNKPSQTPPLFAGADTPLMTLVHLPVSLVFLATFFLLLAVSGRGAAEPVDRETGDVWVSWLQNEPQIAAKLRLFTGCGKALQRDDCWQRCHPVIVENSFPHLFPPPQRFYVLCSFLRPIPSSLLHYKVFSCPPLDLLSRIWKAGFRNRPCSARFLPSPCCPPQSSCLIHEAFNLKK